MASLSVVRLTLVAVLAASLAGFSCSNAPAPPQQGTPAFYWAAARETYAAGDYAKTAEHLEQISSGDSEIGARARPWLLILTSGAAAGYMSLADAFEAGARARQSESASFRRQTNNFRAAANRNALVFAETFEKFQKAGQPMVPLAFSFPTGSAGPVAGLGKVANGVAPAPGELATLEKRALERAILLSACRAAGAPEDAARAQEVFKASDPQVARATFVMAMADSLHEQAQLYGRTKLDDPGKLKIFSTRALAALDGLPESKQTKELRAKVSGSLKSIQVAGR